MLPEPLRPVGQGNVRMIANAVRLDVCLVNEVKSVLIAQFIESFRLRVVRGTHGVDIVHLHQPYVLQHQRLVYCVTAHRVMLVHICPLEINCLPV